MPDDHDDGGRRDWLAICLGVLITICVGVPTIGYIVLWFMGLV